MTEQANSKPATSDTILGRTIVEMGLATEQELQDCLELQRQLAEESGPRPLAELMLANGLITERQLKRVQQEVHSRQQAQQIPGFQILGKLGSGAMATVVKARQLSLDRIVAIKVLPLKYMNDPQFVERFYDEGRAAAKLNHPNIVQAYDVGRAGDFHYFVMEYVEGYTVHDYLEKHGRYEEKEALKIIIQIAEALEHVHAKGLMHRDIKPKNIMITKQGVAKLADMGLARQVADLAAAQAEAGKAYGTPYYISPEQIRGKLDIDFRADIYGLGATFYHMVTGQVPFEGPNPSAVMHKHLKEPLIPPDHINPNLSAGVSEVIEVMMAKLPDERYASTSDLLEDLRALLNDEPPRQARSKIELTKLAELEAGGQVLEPENRPVGSAPGLLEQPLFWLAMASILLNVVLIILLVLK